MGAAARLRLALFAAGAAAWNVCDVADHGAVGDGQTDDSRALRSALAACDEVVIPRHRSCVSGPLNLTSNQVLRVDGALLASTIPAQYPLMEPVVGYGWSRDTNCFPANSTRRGFREGARRHAPVVGAYNASNVSVVGGGVIDGRAGEPLGWWDNCTRCRGARPPDPAFPPDEAFCLAASRPKLLEFQYVTGLTVAGNAVGDPLHLKDSPFWTLTPSYSRNVRVRDLRITAPIRTPGIGNTDGVNLDSCRDALAAPGAPPRKRTLPKLFARRAAPPGRRACTEERDRPSTVAPRTRVPLVGARVATAADTGGERLRQQQRRRRLHEERPRRLRHQPRDPDGGRARAEHHLRRPACVIWAGKRTDDRVGDDAGRGGFAVGSEMSGGVRNVTFRDSVLGAGPQSRGIDVKTSVGRGGYIIDVTFENIRAPSPFPKANVNVHSALRDDPDVPGDDLVPVIGNLRFANVSGPSGCGFSFCDKANGSACYNLVVEGDRPDGCVAPDPGPPLPAMTFSCKRVARTLFGEITLPWPVCVPREAPVNVYRDYPNWGPARGAYPSLGACKAACH